MNKDEYFKSVCTSFLKTHEDEIRKHFHALNHELEVLVGLSFPEVKKQEFFFSLLMTVHIMEMITVLMSLKPEKREESMENICSTLKSSLAHYEKKLGI